MLTLPNLLTLSRIAAVPVLVALLWVREPLFYLAAWALYALICVTDYLDGYLARRWRTESKLGAFLDPIADKIMVASVLMMLVGRGVIADWDVIAALAILLREIMVSGLREFLAGGQVTMPVTYLAKVKTAFQMVALGTLILGVGTPGAPWIHWVGVASLWVAAVTTAITGWQYLRVGIRHMH